MKTIDNYFLQMGYLLHLITNRILLEDLCK